MGRRAGSIAGTLLLAGSLAAGLLVTGLAWFLLRTRPTRSGTVRLPGLSGPVTVRRDAHGIPHLYATTMVDLFMAQGWVHASERAWQMEVFRRFGAGRLAELFGTTALETDRVARVLGWRRAAERDIAAASPETREALEAYAGGVNAWLEAHRRLPFPFIVAGLVSGKGGGLSGYRPEPWTPADSATWAKVQAWILGGNWDSELFRLLVARRLGEAAVEDLTARYDPRMPVIVPTGTPGAGGAAAAGWSGRDRDRTDGGGGGAAPDRSGGDDARHAQAEETAGESVAVESPGVVRAVALDPGAADRLLRAARSAVLHALGGIASGRGGLLGPAVGRPILAPIGSAGLGSNEWTVGPAKSASGHALLANDPHLFLTMPSVWIINGLHCRPTDGSAPYDVAGVSFPGTPAVVLGHNRRIAWGATNVDPDVQDLYLERLDPADPRRYEYRGEMRPFTTRTETIEVGRGRPLTLTVRETVHGAVLDDLVRPLRPVDDGGGALGPAGHVVALCWTATREPEQVLDALLALARAEDFDGFRAALARFGSPAQNFIYADVDGHIGYQLAGRIPIRPPGFDGSRPAPGWDGAADWLGHVPYDDLPRLYDPPAGFIVTANNAPVDERYPYHLGDEWDPGYRAQRITNLIAAKEGLTLDDLAAVQLDTRLLRADPLIAAARIAAPATDDGRTVRGLVTGWDGDCAADSTGAAAGEVFAYRLLRAVFDEPLDAGREPDALARLFVGDFQAGGVLRRILEEALAGDGSSRWWGGRPPAEALGRALDDAGAELRRALGEPGRWSWGRLHRLNYREQTLGLGGIRPLERILNRGPLPAAGSTDTVNNTVWFPSAGYPDPFEPAKPAGDLFRVFDTIVTPSYRGLYDTGDWDASRIVNVTGQSDVPFDRHYDDMIDAWRAGRTVPFPFSDTAVEAATVETLTLVP